MKVNKPLLLIDRNIQTIDKENIPESESGEVDFVLLEKIEKNNDN